MTKLEGKVAIITGGASGIGRGMALSFVKEGAIVVIVDLNEEAGKETVKELQVHESKSIFIQANLMEHHKISGIVKQVVDTFGKLDILVNNAHASRNKAFEDVTMEDMDLSFNTGFYPTFHFMQAAIPYLKETKGSIINFASGTGIIGKVQQASYAAAKEAIRAISRVAANEFGPFGVNVNLISPIADSPGIQAWQEEFPDRFDKMLDGIPLKRLGRLEEDIGRVAVFLASEDASYITGQTMMVDGGSVMLR